MRSTALRWSGFVVILIATTVVRPAPALPGQHVVIGSGVDIGRAISFSVVATEEAVSGSQGDAVVGGDTFEVECLTVRDFTSFHIATFGGQGEAGSYYVTVVTATATGTLLLPTFHVTRYADGNACDLGSHTTFLIGRGAFFIGPETPSVLL